MGLFSQLTYYEMSSASARYAYTISLEFHNTFGWKVNYATSTGDISGICNIQFFKLTRDKTQYPFSIPN